MLSHMSRIKTKFFDTRFIIIWVNLVEKLKNGGIIVKIGGLPVSSLGKCGSFLPCLSRSPVDAVLFLARIFINSRKSYREARGVSRGVYRQ